MLGYIDIVYGNPIASFNTFFFFLSNSSWLWISPWPQAAFAQPNLCDMSLHSWRRVCLYFFFHLFMHSIVAYLGHEHYKIQSIYDFPTDGGIL